MSEDPQIPKSAIQKSRNRQELEKNAPTEMESRGDFLARLSHTSRRTNERQPEEAMEPILNMKARAKEIIRLKGVKCRW